jgi:hypothetical protein
LSLQRRNDVYGGYVKDYPGHDVHVNAVDCSIAGREEKEQGILIVLQRNEDGMDPCLPDGV